MNDIKKHLSSVRFMSGITKNVCLNVWSDGITKVVALTIKKNGEFEHYKAPKNMPMNGLPILLSGELCSNPAEMTKLAHKYPTHKIFASPQTGELDLEIEKIPRRVPQFQPFEEDIPNCTTMEYDPNIDSDKYGKMAHCIAKHKVPALNEIKIGADISPFYGRVLSSFPIADTPPVYIMNMSSFIKAFPAEPFSIRHLGACVPVRLKNNETMQTQIRNDDEELDIYIATDYSPEIPEFMNFFQVFLGRWIVFSYDPKGLKFRKAIPVYRYNKAYRPSQDWFLEKFNGA